MCRALIRPYPCAIYDMTMICFSTARNRREKTHPLAELNDNLIIRARDIEKYIKQARSRVDAIIYFYLSFTFTLLLLLLYLLCIHLSELHRKKSDSERSDIKEQAKKKTP